MHDRITQSLQFGSFCLQCFNLLFCHLFLLFDLWDGWSVSTFV
jgi:hypothetical protein